MVTGRDFDVVLVSDEYKFEFMPETVSETCFCLVTIKRKEHVLRY
jgi:hypothetical protein